MAQGAIVVEGGLLAADLMERIAATPEDVAGQRPGDFGLAGRRLSDEIQAAFSDARAYWEAFQRRRAHAASLTTATRENWMIPLLQDLLGYDLRFQKSAVQAGGTGFTISHLAGAEEAAPPVHIVAADRPLDRRADGARQSPHALVQEYLNRSDALWGIATNGVKLRLLRDSERLSRPSYVEFDLQAIVEGNLYSEFVQFFRLAHRSRLPLGGADAHECWLERWYQQGIEEGGRVREKLRDGVEAAIQTLGTGFLAASDSLREALSAGRVNEMQLYGQLLRLVYRLLFLMVAEERRLLLVEGVGGAGRQAVYTRWYAVSRLRERAERRRGEEPHADLWEGLKQTFRLFRTAAEAARLGLTPLDGELFGTEACHDLERASIANDALLAAIHSLSTFREERGRRGRGVRRRINYAGLDVEELGSVYESLLDFHPRVSLDPPRFELAAGSERKTTGSYYTPPELVRELIESALVPVMEARLAEAKTSGEKEAALLSLKVCDPAAGSGHFLLAAARRIGRALASVRTGEAEPAPEAYRHAVRDVIRNCLYAVDRNPLAVDLCKVALWIEGHAAGLPLSFLDHHLRCGDSLVGVLDLSVLNEGVPDDAYKALTGDDKKIAAELRKQNRAERQRPLLRKIIRDDMAEPAARFAELAGIAEATPEEVQAKAARYRALREDPGWACLRQACDLWTAAFFAPLTETGRQKTPTTRDVWEALAAERPLQGQRAAAALDVSRGHRFFHWPLEFPEVFAAGGFDAMLGNPPWERIKLQEQEFFATRDPEIAKAPNKAARERLIKALFAPDAPPEKRALGLAFDEAKHAAEAASLFVRESGRFPLTAVGDINTYAIFAETFLRAIAPEGRAGFIVPTGIATDDSTKAFFDAVMSDRRLVSLFDFENREAIFPAVHRSYKFCLLTLGSAVEASTFLFFATRTDHLGEERRRFTLSPEDIALINPNTRTCPVFRSQADAELTRKIYRAVPVLIDGSKGEAGNPWGLSFMRMFDMANDSGLFRKARQLGGDMRAMRDGANWRAPDGTVWLPLYEAKMIHHYDHRWATYDEAGAETREVTEAEKRDPAFQPQPRYWVAEREVILRAARVPKIVREAYLSGSEAAAAKAILFWLAGHHFNREGEAMGDVALRAAIARTLGSPAMVAFDLTVARVEAPKLEQEFPLEEADLELMKDRSDRPLDLCWALMRARTPRWLLGWRDITNATNERTMIAAAFPRAGANHKVPLFFTDRTTKLSAALLASWLTLAFDYVARQKVGGTSLSYFYLKQFPAVPPSTYGQTELDFIVPRVLELIYTAEDMRPFARDLGYDGPPFRWDPERRAMLRAELDAYYAYLYGLTRDELRYILDPAEVAGPDYPTETFRVLKENEMRRFGEYRTRRLVLEAWDRFCADGTFPAEKLKELGDVNAAIAALKAERERAAALQQEREALAAMLARARETARPTLFVEGATDAAVIEAAWAALDPGEAMPFSVVAAEGTKNMGSLAGKGRALREVLGERIVCALADNDSEGRALVNDGHLARGGQWRQLPNGVHWCLLKPTDSFIQAMKRFEIPAANWPFTLEACFAPALRRQAKAEGAYAFSGLPQAELLAEPALAQRIFAITRDLTEADDAWWYLMAPAPEAKEAFAAWLARPGRATPDTFAAFEPILSGLRSLLTPADSNGATGEPSRRRA